MAVPAAPSAPPVIERWSVGSPVPADELSRLLADYHLQTQQEKGEPVIGAGSLPDRYAREVDDPAAAFAGGVVFVARLPPAAVHDSGAPVLAGCAVLMPVPVDGARWGELKRLWVDPAVRGAGLAGALVDAAVSAAAEEGMTGVRLSVWRWREPAVALYRRRGFEEVAPDRTWEPERPDLICFERRLR